MWGNICLKRERSAKITSAINLVVNVGKYLPQKRKVRENNECHKALVIFADLSLLRQIFPHINPKRIKYIIYYISSDDFVNKCGRTKKVVPDFQHGENIHCDREIFPLA